MMTKKNTVPGLSISQILAVLDPGWHSSEYYISPDENLMPLAADSEFRPGFYGLFLCTNGWMDIEINQVLLHAERHCFFAAGPDSTAHRIRQSPGCKGRLLLFTKEFLLKNIINTRQFETLHFFSKSQNSCIQLAPAESRSLLQLFDILKDKRDESNLQYHFELIRHLIFSFLYEAAIIYQQHGIFIPPVYSKESDIYSKFRHLLDREGGHMHDLKFYADALCITPKYLIHIVKKTSGRTPGVLIDELIVAEASIRLKKPDQTIAMIAEELHFSDQSSFSKFFKRHTGHTPLSFRKKK